MTYRLALIGRDISHSKSKVIYEKILDESVDYHLLDCSSEADIPNADDLLREFDGISITAPYKKHFCDKVELDELSSQINAINCIYRGKSSGPMGCNTDYIALKKLIPSYLVSFKHDAIVILGDGTMAQVVSSILRGLGKSYDQFSRRNDGPLTSINLAEDNKKLLVINCCARAFEFQGEINSLSTFWDLNYEHSHREKLSGLCRYVDGEELLLEQAKVALGYWGISTP